MIEEKRKNNLFIISGPSGAGEDSIIEGLKKIIPLERVITTTTRKKRPGESQGNPYYFISKEEFKKKIKNKKFFEWAREYDNFYGVTHEEIKRIQNNRKIGIWKTGYKGVISAKKRMPYLKAIFISAPLNTLEKRIRKRSNITESFIQKRMAYTKEWLKHKNIYDYEVVNREGRLEEAIRKIARIIKNAQKL